MVTETLSNLSSATAAPTIPMTEVASTLWTCAPIVASLMSITASLLLLLWLGRLDKSLSSRLMARQLWHLALADTLATAMLLPWFSLATAHTLDSHMGILHHETLHNICLVCHGNNIPYMTSVFVEFHIAVSTVASILRRPAVLRVLAKYLPLVWICGLTFGSVVVGLGMASWNTNTGSCNPKNIAERFKAYVMATVLALNVFTSIVGMAVAARHHGASVENRIWRRAQLFVFAAIVTWVPFVVFSLWKHSDGEMLNANNAPWFYLQSVFLESNGSFNAGVYAWQSGFLQRTGRRRAAYAAYDNATLARLAGLEGSPASFNVAFNSQAEECDISRNSCPTTSDGATSDGAISTQMERKSWSPNTPTVGTAAEWTDSCTSSGSRKSRKLAQPHFLLSFDEE